MYRKILLDDILQYRNNATELGNFGAQTIFAVL
jgi:hypothetical protein